MSIFKHKFFDLRMVGSWIGRYMRRREDARILEMAYSMISPICPYADLNEAMKTGAAARAA